jgi:EAL domain-containing protein (putative c-di-GMP-specific phosphodiesterase class I)
VRAGVSLARALRRPGATAGERQRERSPARPGRAARDRPTGARRHGLDGTDLAIELTETALIDDSSVAADSLRELRSLGVTILLDDFGTGYSSLSHLGRFPIDALKIDRSFVMHLGVEKDDFGIVRAIAAMADALGLDVVAEGVETAEQAAEALALGCGSAQGYYFARPAPPAVIESLISSGLSLTRRELR